MSTSNKRVVELLQALTQGDESHRQATAGKVEALEAGLRKLREQLEEGGKNEKKRPTLHRA